MQSNKMKKIISLTLTLMMLCSNFVFADSKTADYTGHWAEQSIASWMDQGYVKGYEDGSFRPENKITRAEFISIVNRAFGFTEEKSVNYKDVKKTHWAYNEFARANAAGYIGGYEDGTLRPNNNVTRQEMASVISRLLALEPTLKSQAYLDLKDHSAIPSWSAGAISSLVDQGIVNLREGNYAPTAAATRAEVVVALDKSQLNQIKVSYDTAGTYTAGTVNGSLAINAKDVVLENTIVKGNLIIGEKVGEGNVTLKNVTVEGKTIVRGGGMNTVTLENSNIVKLIVEKKDGKVRILAVGDTYVDQVNLKSGAKLESKDAKAENFGTLVVEEGISASQSVIIAASFAEVEVKVVNGNIEILSGTIDSLVIDESAAGLKINLAAGVVVKEAVVDAKVTIDGKGKIETAVVSTKDATITVPVDKTEGTPSTNAGSGGGGGGGGSSSGGAVSAISVAHSNIYLDLETNNTATLTVTILPRNASNKNLTWSSDNEDVVTVKNGVVTAEGPGTAIITATSNNGKTAETIVTVLEEELQPGTVAMIQTKQYDSLRAAVDEANNTNAEVIMIADVTIAGGSGGYGVAGLVHNGSTINGNGYTLTVTEADETWDCAIYTTGGTIKNLTVGGAFRGIFTAGSSEDIIIDNVVLDNVCYAFNADINTNQNYSVIFKNSTLNGWTSYGRNYISVSFDSCNFGKGTGTYNYAYMRPYDDTKFTNCTFSEGYELDARQTDDITLYNCTVGGVKLTQDNLTTLLGANAAKAKVLTIEDDVYYYGTTLYGLTNEFTGTTLTVREGTTVIGAGALQDNSTIEEVVLPDGLITIEANAFKRCTNLETINLPNSLTSIGDQAFQQCSGLTRIIIPNSVTAIGYQAYYACTSVTELVIPEGVITIGIGAFRELAITEVTIPSTVRSLGSFAFRDCKQLRNVYFNCETVPEIIIRTEPSSAIGQVFRVMDGSGNVVIKITNEEVYNAVIAEGYEFREVYIDNSHHVSCVYAEQVAEGVLLTAPKTYEIFSKAGLKNLDAVLADADLGEGKAATVNLAADIDLTGETWTPISRMWFTFNGNGHTISNLTTESTRKAGLFGYAGAVTVNDLTLENVTVTGSQAGAFAGAGEGLTVNNCFLKGTNIINFTPTEETWNGIGAITGVLLRGTVNVTIDEYATVTLNRGDMTTEVGCVYVDNLTGHITENNGRVINNGKVVETGSLPYTAAEDTVETQQDVAEAVEALEAAVSTFNDAKQEVIDEEEIVDEQVDTEEDIDNGLEGEVEAVDEEDAA